MKKFLNQVLNGLFVGCYFGAMLVCCICLFIIAYFIFTELGGYLENLLRH